MNNYFVDPAGNDVHAGSATLPWLTLQHGVSQLKAGDTLTARAGKYAGFVIGWDTTGLYGYTTGTAAAPITIQADPAAAPGSVIINAPPVGLPDFLIDTENAHGTVDYLTIQGFAINGAGAPNATHGIRITQSTGVKVLGNTVTGVSGFGIFTSHTTDCTIDSNKVSGTLGGGSTGHGIYVSDSAVRPVVTNNAIAANGGEGLHMNGDASNGGTGLISNATVVGNIIHGNGENGINCDGVQNSKFSGNLVYGNARHQMALYKQDAAGAPIGNLITGNTFDGIGTSGAGFQAINAAVGTVLQNNIIFGGANGDVVIDAGSRVNLISDYNITAGTYGDYTGTTVILAAWRKATGQDAHSVQSTPIVFTAPNASPPDFTLAAKGPAMGAGTPAGTNIGYAAGSPPTPPAAVPPTPFVLGLYTFPAGEPTAAQYKEMVRQASYGKIRGTNGGVPGSDQTVDIEDLNWVTSHWQLKVPAAN